ncbi:MAG: Hpt domain-containing protein [Smithellaceae bacterium]
MTDQEQRSSEGETIVIVEEDLEELIPGYLENRRHDIVVISSALEHGDFELIRNTGHKMKGSGGGYGFDRITDIGRDIEEAAKAQHGENILKQVEALRLYLGHVKVVYQK